LAIIQCYAEVIYEKESTEALVRQKSLVKWIIENILGLPAGTLRI